MRLKPLHLVAFLVLLAGCAPGPVEPVDARTAHLHACQAYTSALERLEVWQRAGKLDAEQDEALRRLDRTTTPLCLGEPSAAINDLMRAALRQVEDLLLELAVEENAA